MELFYVTVIGGAIGAVLRYLLPGRDVYGLALLPAVGAASTALIWEGLTWLGWPYDGAWIWVASLLGGTLASIATAILTVRLRKQHDAQLLHQLSGGRA